MLSSDLVAVVHSASADKINVEVIEKYRVHKCILQYQILTHTLVGCEVAYPTRHIVRHIRNIAPGTIPRASGLWVSGTEEFRK
jgi:hypothetical protein